MIKEKMKKCFNKMFTKNDKGIAMITVIIAITFMGILAASLIYMAYMNYLTKSMRYYSTDNFYTDEFGLDDLSSSIQQQVVVEYNADPTKSGEDLLRTVCGVSTATGHDAYDTAKLTSLIKYANNNNRIESISVNTAIDTNSEANFVVSGNMTTLKGVKITTRTIEGYESTITTNIDLKFPGSGSGDIDVNSFSVIGNKTFKIEEGNMIMSGNFYVTDGDDNIDNFGDALVVGTGSRNIVCTMLSPRAIIDGNVTVKARGALSISGTVAVNGNIYLENDSILFVSGNLKVRGKVYRKGTGGSYVEVPNSDLTAEKCDLIIGSKNIEVGADFDTSLLDKNKKGKLADVLLVPIKVYKNGSWLTVSMNAMASYPTGIDDGLYSGSGDRSDTQTSVTSNYTGQKFKTQFGVQNTINDGDLNNSLILIPDTPSLTINGTPSFIDSTILAKKDIKFDKVDRTATLTFMSGKGYEACKDALFLKTDGNIGGKYAFGTGPSGEKAYTEAQLQTLANSNPTRYKTTTLDGHLFVYDTTNNKNILRYGTFINKKSSVIISELFNGFLGKQDPTVTTCSYAYWIKD